MALGHGEVGEPGGHQPQVEGALGGQLAGPLDRSRPPGEPSELLGLAPQAGGGRRREPALQVLQRPPGPHGGQRGGQGEPGRGGVVDVVGGHRRHPPLDGQHGQGVVAGAVERVAVVPQLDGQVLGAEAVDQVVEGPPGGGRPLVGQGRGQRPLAAPGQDLPVAAVAVGQGVEGEDGPSLLPALQVGLGDGPAESGVALGVAGQHHQVGPVRVGHAGAQVGPVDVGQGELGAEHGGQAERPGRHREPDRPVEAVVVGERQRRQAEPDRLGGQLLGVAGAVEEGEVGVGVELGVGHRRSGRLSRRSPRPTTGRARPGGGGPPGR